MSLGEMMLIYAVLGMVWLVPLLGAVLLSVNLVVLCKARENVCRRLAIGSGTNSCWYGLVFGIAALFAFPNGEPLIGVFMLAGAGALLGTGIKILTYFHETYIHRRYVE